MITEDDARHTREFEDHYAILPEPFEGVCAHHPLAESGKPCPEGFHFSSDSNNQWITGAELMDMLIKHKMIPA
jgi:UDP-N-acetylglucosamine 4,6-dehydratase